MAENQLTLGGPPAPEAVQQSSAAPQPTSDVPPSPMAQHFSSAQDKAQLQYQRMVKATATLGKVRNELDKLVALADTVTQDDVVEAAGKLVADGLGSVAVAGLLATMPDNGEALQAWVAKQDLGVQHREMQAQRALELTRHALGVSAMRSIIAHSAMQQQAEAIQPSPQPPALAGDNALTLGAPSNG